MIEKAGPRRTKNPLLKFCILIVAFRLDFKIVFILASLVMYLATLAIFMLGNPVLRGYTRSK